jgi:hypothetical protein
VSGLSAVCEETWQGLRADKFGLGAAVCWKEGLAGVNGEVTRGRGGKRGEREEREGGEREDGGEGKS